MGSFLFFFCVLPVCREKISFDEQKNKKKSLVGVIVCRGSVVLRVVRGGVIVLSCVLYEGV